MLPLLIVLSFPSLVGSDPILTYYFKDELIDLTLSALEKAVSFVDKNIGVVLFDCTLGIFVAGVILRSSLSSISDENQLGRIEQVLDKINHAANVSLEKIPQHYKVLGIRLLDEDVWNREVDYAYLVFNGKPHEDLFNMSTFLISDSTYCIEKVINLTKSHQPRNCTLPKKCKNIFINPNHMSFGYLLTHRFLFFLYGKSKCVQIYKAYLSQQEEICFKMYEQAVSVMANQTIIIDLMFEYILMCGGEGYANFFKVNWLKYFISAQHPDGCFTESIEKGLLLRREDKEYMAATRRNKRRSYIFPDGCSDHATGLATATLASYIKYFYSLDRGRAVL